MTRKYLYISRLLLIIILVLCQEKVLAQDNLALKTWNSQNTSNIQMLKLGKEVLLLPQPIKLKDMGNETIKKSIYVGDYVIHLFTNNVVIGMNTNYREQYQILIGHAKDIYTVDANNLGFDLDDDNFGYALTVNNSSARPIVPPGTQMISNNDVRTFYDSKNKSRHYDISKYIGDMRDKKKNPHNPFIQALYPIWQLADALLNCRPIEYSEINVNPDYLTALSEVSEVIKKDLLIDESNQFLLIDGAFTSVDEIRSIVEKALLELTFKENTEEAYDRLLANISDYGYIKQATTAREKVAYNNVYYSNELSECERYLLKYKNVDNSHYADIEKLQYELAYKKLDNTTEACKKYLQDYPNSFYNSMVKERLYKCAYLDLAPTAAACQEYIDDYPESPFINDVRNSLYKYAYQELGESIDEYESYLDKYPQSTYCQEVSEKLERLTYYDALEKDDIEIYSQFLEKFPFSKYTDDIIQHRTLLIKERERYAAEYPDYEDNSEIVWDISDDYEYIEEAPAENTTNNKSSSTRKRAKNPTSYNRTYKGGKKTQKKKTVPTQQPTKSTNKDASKKANSLIFGPEN